MKQTVVPIRKTAPKRKPKTVPANQQAVDALPLDTGTWRVAGIPGLYLRCRAASKSYMLQRRVRGALVKHTIGEMPLKVAKTEAAREWVKMRPRLAGARLTLEGAFDEFVAQRQLAPKTRHIYEYNLEHYLGDWKGRALADIGQDRAGVRALYHALTNKCGPATGAQVVRLLSAVYRYARAVDLTLPEPPTVAVRLPAIPSRDWAMSREALKAWWCTVTRDEEGNESERGVKTLGPVKRAWWQTCLLTGARSNSISALEWSDIDFEKRIIRFRVTKGNRPYIVPAADRLIELLTAYRDSGEVPPSPWVFPSPMNSERHLVNVRDDKRGVQSAHRLRHTFRTVLAELGASPDQCRLLMGHSMGGDVSRGYITAPLLVESLRPVVNAVAGHYYGIVKW